MSKGLQISGGVVGARLGVGLIGEDLLDRLTEQVEEVLCGVDVLIRQSGQVAEVVVAVEVGVVATGWDG